MQKNSLPLIGITMGDPSGIGPEIIIKAFVNADLYGLCIPIVIGDRNILGYVANKVLKKQININTLKKTKDAICSKNTINLISASSLKHYKPGIADIEGGRAMVSYIEHAVRMALKKELDAIVTCPINKSLMHASGFSYDGHTPFIAHLTKTKDYVMMLAGDRLRVSLVTIHVALKQVPSLITKERVLKTISITANALVNDFKIKSPRIAVAGLNPHAGEGGLFGNEEETISEAIRDAEKMLKMDIYGPLPPDTVYYRASRGEFDAVVSMYHDQGLIPLKLLHFSDAVNITLGLPIIRTSVDHGTAYDIAGKGIADESSLVSAIKMAAFIANNRKCLRIKEQESIICDYE